MIQDHLFLLYQAIQKKYPRDNKASDPPVPLSTTKRRKSHRYEKKTVFDIMGVVYEYNGLSKQRKAA
ncbi:unnamed protein product [Bacillus thuringiensis DB27]|uniref:Transposase n=1 Tax=Bacillus thuringiensis DB27 TaxID=1431339 RepID=W8YCB8_BACTU|nr:unnamed protein product [Bacillus thuringiensis DB27]